MVKDVPTFETVNRDHELRADEPGSESPAEEVWREASEVGEGPSRDAWAEAARDVLLDASRHYHGLVTYKELATEVQHRTRIRTKQQMHHWIGDVLGRVSADCSRRHEPLLSSLCVNTQGSVGTGYAVAVQAATGETPGDGDDHAARERLSCYRHFDAAGLPAEGGSPALTPKLAAARTRARKARALERPVAICPTCYMQLPATGSCNYCD